MSDDGDDAGPGLGLDEVLAALREDLVTARDETDEAGGGYGLGVTEVEVELTAEVRRSVRGKASGGVKWFVLSADASAEADQDRTRTHRITLTLRPTGPSGDAGSPDPAGQAGLGSGTGATTIGTRVAGAADPEDA